MRANAITEPSNAPTRQPGQGRFSATQLLIAIVLLLVGSPFIAELPGGKEINAALMTAVLLAGVLAVGHRRQTLVLAALLAAPAVFWKWLHYGRPDVFPHCVFLAAVLCFVGFVIVNLLHFVLRAPVVNREVLSASVSAYLMLGLLWAFAYDLVATMNPAAFAFNSPDAQHQSMTSPNALYFSFVTLSTVGYGDITPVSHIARMLATVEAMTGGLYLAVLIARLVSMSSAQPPEREKLD